MAYTTIDDGSAFFQTKLYAGTGSTLSLTNDGNSNLQPDWVWIKNRDSTNWHILQDSSRGSGKSLFSNDTYQETSDSSTRNIQFDSNGITLSGSTSSFNDINDSSDNFVAWQWKCNGGTTSSNTDGDITATVQTNSTAGFSIITYTGNGNNLDTIGHGLGATPEFIIIRNRDNSSEPWAVFTTPTGIKALALNTTAAQATDSGYWSNTNPDSTHFTVGSHGSTGAAAAFVAYAFTGIQGYSKFGSYEGNNNAGGPFVYTGFKPAWTMIKSIDDTYNWVIQDRERFGGINSGATDQNLAANSTSASPSSASFSGNEIDYLSNGFKLRSNAGNTNAAQTYIYMAFAHHPFVSSKGVPVTAG